MTAEGTVSTTGDHSVEGGTLTIEFTDSAVGAVTQTYTRAGWVPASCWGTRRSISGREVTSEGT